MTKHDIKNYSSRTDLNDQCEYSQLKSEDVQDSHCLSAVIEKLTTPKLLTIFEALENLDKAIFEVFWENSQSEDCTRKISQIKGTIYKVRRAIQMKARENHLLIPAKKLDEQQIKNLESHRLEELSNALEDAYAAIVEASYVGFKNNLHLEELTQAKRTIAKMKQICEDIEATEVDITSIQDITMNDLPRYLRSLDQQSCDVFYLNFQNALTALCRELEKAQDMGFEWVGEVTVAANIIEDALEKAEAFTNEG